MPFFDVHERILAGNDRAARHNREHFRDLHDVIAVNLMGSPGAGKTAVLEATARELGRTGEAAKVASSPAIWPPTTTPAASSGRIRSCRSRPAACHLEADMVHCGAAPSAGSTTSTCCSSRTSATSSARPATTWARPCGRALSVTEGEDKPLKYPTAFQKADAWSREQIDLLPQLSDVSVDILEKNIASVMPVPRMLKVSARTPAKGLLTGCDGSTAGGRLRTAVYAASAGAGAVA